MTNCTRSVTRLSLYSILMSCNSDTSTDDTHEISTDIITCHNKPEQRIAARNTE